MFPDDYAARCPLPQPLLLPDRLTGRAPPRDRHNFPEVVPIMERRTMTLHLDRPSTQPARWTLLNPFTKGDGRA